MHRLVWGSRVAGQSKEGEKISQERNFRVKESLWSPEVLAEDIAGRGSVSLLYWVCI